MASKVKERAFRGACCVMRSVRRAQETSSCASWERYARPVHPRPCLYAPVCVCLCFFLSSSVVCRESFVVCRRRNIHRPRAPQPQETGYYFLLILIYCCCLLLCVSVLSPNGNSKVIDPSDTHSKYQYQIVGNQ